MASGLAKVHKNYPFKYFIQKFENKLNWVDEFFVYTLLSEDIEVLRNL